MVWIGSEKGLFVWHALRDGVRWYYKEDEDLMFFKIEQFPKHLTKDIVNFYTNTEKVSQRYESWVELITSQFNVAETDLSDKDDPVFENPEFLVDRDSQDKVFLLQTISSVLQTNQIRVFLGGAAAGALMTKTRTIRDLDLRVDGLERDIFNEKKYPDFFENQILKPLKTAGLSIEKYEKASNTTMRLVINGIEVSITSEPSTDQTLSRGEMVTGIESLGEFDFLLDKAAAAAKREDPEKLATDIFDIIKVKESIPGEGKGVLSGLKSLRPKSNPNFLAIKLTQISKSAMGNQYKDESISVTVQKLCGLLEIEKSELPKILEPIIKELKEQVEITVV